MTAGDTPRDDAELEAFLGRQSTISTDYDNLEQAEPPAALDEKILAAAKAVAKPAVAKPAPAKATPAPPTSPRSAARVSPAIPSNPAERRKRPRDPIPTTDGDDDAPSSSRPRWLVPAALAASVLVVVGVGLTVFMNSPSGMSDSPLDGLLFAKRARERSEADKAAAAASAKQDAEVVVLDSAPLPPPPVFEPEGPQVQDLDAAIALIRKALVLANQIAAAPAGNLADTASSVAPAAPPSVIQPRERRLTKIIELYDGGNPDLAADSLEIFLRDFEDDPISQRILAIKP